MLMMYNRMLKTTLLNLQQRFRIYAVGLWFFFFVFSPSSLWLKKNLL